MVARRGPIVVSGNSSWNIVNFRVPLIRALEQAGFEPVVVAPVDPAAEQRMAGLGVRRIIVEMERSGLNPIRDLRLLRRYLTIVAELRPAAYLGYTIKPNIYGALAARLCGVPAILNVSGLGTAFIRAGPLTAIVSALYRVALGSARVVFFQNQDDLATFVERRLVRADQARRVPGSGIDASQFAPVPLPSGATRFLLIARLLGDKGVREYVAAARLLKSEGAAASFLLLGPLDEANRTALRATELDSWVAEGVLEYLGVADDVRPHIAAAHAVVLPSYREGLPRSLLEGAAMGRLLVATDVPGCRDVVVDGVNGFLCAPRDAQALASAMRKVIALSPEQRAAFGEAAQAKVQAEFSEKSVIDAYMRALDECAPARS